MQVVAGVSVGVLHGSSRLPRRRHDDSVPWPKDREERNAAAELLVRHSVEVELEAHGVEDVLLEEDDSVLLEPQPRGLAVDLGENVGDPILVSLAARRPAPPAIVEVSDSQDALALGLEELRSRVEGSDLVGDHRERVGEGDEVALAVQRQLLRHHLLVREVAEDTLHNVLEPRSLDAALGDLEEGERDVDHVNLGEPLADGLLREELQVAAGPASDVDPDHLLLLERDAVRQHGPGVEEVLAEGVVLLLLRLVEGLHLGSVFGNVVLLSNPAGDHALDQREGDDLDASRELGQEALRSGLSRRPVACAEVKADRAVHLGHPGTPVHGDAIASVIDLHGLQPDCWQG
eukprot:749737-Hanusia_phi.AAC.5